MAWSIGDNYVNAFIKFGPSTKATLWPLLTDKRWDIRYFAVSVLGKLDDNEVVQSLSKLANDENIHVRDAVSIALPSDLR